jgi:uncharacterized protein
VRSIARRHPLLTYLILLYGIASLAFALPLLASSGIGLLPIELPGVAPFVLLVAVALAAIAFVVTALADGPAATRELRGRVFRFRASPVWYLAASILLPLSALAAVVIGQGTLPLSNLAAQPALFGSLGVSLVVAFLLVNWWEEVGWTGFVLDRLQRRTHPVWASVVTAWLQGAIHLPLVFIADGVTDGRVRPEDYPFYFVALFVLPIPVRIIATWLYNASGRSLPIVGIFHAGLGIATGTAFVPEIAPGFATVWVYAAFAIVAGAVLLVTRGRLALERQRVTHGELMLAAGAT